MSDGVSQFGYLVASALFIFALHWMNAPATARKGVFAGVAGTAIAVVGSILVTGGDYPLRIRVLGAIALFASMTNIVSGFLITNRMLKMFKTGDHRGDPSTSSGSSQARSRGDGNRS